MTMVRGAAGAGLVGQTHRVGRTYEQHDVRERPGGLEPEVDEARAGDLRRLAHVRDVELRDDLLRELARIGAQLFREDHRDVRLVIAEAHIGRGGDLRLRVVREAGERGAEPRLEKIGDGVHMEKKGPHF